MDHMRLDLEKWTKEVEKKIKQLEDAGIINYYYGNNLYYSKIVDNPTLNPEVEQDIEQ